MDVEKTTVNYCKATLGLVNKPVSLIFISPLDTQSTKNELCERISGLISVTIYKFTEFIVRLTLLLLAIVLCLTLSVNSFIKQILSFNYCIVPMVTE